MVGGARVFGPKPRDYGFKLNKKVKQLARKSALTYKAKANNIVVLDSIELSEPKTKSFLSIANNLKVNDKKSLIVLSEPNKNVSLSVRNLQNANVVTVSGLNTYRILNADKLVLTESSVSALNEIFKA